MNLSEHILITKANLSGLSLDIKSQIDKLEGKRKERAEEWYSLLLESLRGVVKMENTLKSLPTKILEQQIEIDRLNKELEEAKEINKNLEEGL